MKTAFAPLLMLLAACSGEATDGAALSESPNAAAAAADASQAARAPVADGPAPEQLRQEAKRVLEQSIELRAKVAASCKPYDAAARALLTQAQALKGSWDELPGTDLQKADFMSCGNLPGYVHQLAANCSLGTDIGARGVEQHNRYWKEDVAFCKEQIAGE